MYSLLLTCSSADIESISADLWEAGTLGIEELESGGETQLIAAFPSHQAGLLERFANYSPQWRLTPPMDWIAETHRAWPARAIGDRLFLAPPWCDDATPPGRRRIVHVPGLACGTGEHPCTQLALIALEKFVRPNTTLIDIGAGSGILAIAALRLGAARAIALDPDEAALQTARTNFSLNALQPLLIAGSADCIAAGTADIAIANINATVLLSIFDDLLRITRRAGLLVLTGFPQPELPPLQQLLPQAEISSLSGWSCVTATPS
ncbi:MAG TPA: 50S ribosomal protein L11 methyltransferase [Bryobacteraceae bacterium]|jgi:ribosomal protein L11 methyltransferase|nr:50S ribosomal protein L11 methyltransferase [Bryobacteraceae bacterium]